MFVIQSIRLHFQQKTSVKEELLNKSVRDAKEAGFAKDFVDTSNLIETP